MARRFNPAPGWPVPSQDWTPPHGWKPDPAWPPAPAGWRFWTDDTGPAAEPAAERPSRAEPDPSPSPEPGGSVSGWAQPERAGPGFGTWVLKHRTASAVIAAVFLVAVLGAWSTLGRFVPIPGRTVAGPSSGAAGSGPGGLYRQEPPAPPPDTGSLTAAINSALPQSGARVDPDAAGGSAQGIQVAWNLGVGLPPASAKAAARTDAVAILQVIRGNPEFAHSGVSLNGSYQGNLVVEAKYQMDKVSPATLSPANVLSGAEFYPPFNR